MTKSVFARPQWQLNTLSLAFACVAGATMAPTTSYAVDTIHWSGFFTGAFSQSDNEYSYGRFHSISDKGSYLTDSRLGLQGSAAVNDQISLTTQLVAKNNNDNFDVNANWLYAQIKAAPNIQVKLGRMQQPMYLFSSQLEAGYSMPWVRAPQEVYEQQFFNDYTGIEATYKTYVAAHDVSISLLHGVQDNEISAGVLGKVFASEQPLTEYMSSDDYRGLALQIDGDFYRFKLAGVKQTLDIAIDPAAVNTFQLDIARCMATSSTSAKCSTLYSTAALLGGGGLGGIKGDFWSAGLDMNLSDLRFVSEYTVRSVGDFDREGYYLSLIYRLNEMAPYVTYAAHDTTGQDTIDPQKQESMALGMRYDWLPNTALKFEMLHVNPQEGTRGLYHVGYVTEEMESMNAATITLDLIF